MVPFRTTWRSRLCIYCIATKALKCVTCDYTYFTSSANQSSQFNTSFLNTLKLFENINLSTVLRCPARNTANLGKRARGSTRPRASVRSATTIDITSAEGLFSCNAAV